MTNFYQQWELHEGAIMLGWLCPCGHENFDDFGDPSQDETLPCEECGKQSRITEPCPEGTIAKYHAK